MVAFVNASKGEYNKEDEMSLEGKILLAVMLFDCVITLLSVQLGIAIEFNPIMGFFLGQGVVVFVLAKILASVSLVLAFEGLRSVYPEKVRRVRVGQWIAIIVCPFMIVFPNLMLFYSLI